MGLNYRPKPIAFTFRSGKIDKQRAKKSLHGDICTFSQWLYLWSVDDVFSSLVVNFDKLE